MLRLAQRFLLVFIVFAVIGGPAVHLAQSAEVMAPTAMAGMPCDMAMSMGDAGHGTPMPPCKGLTSDCIKLMGCVVDVALPARLLVADVAVAFSTVAYWSAGSAMAGLIRAPEPLPPRTT